jgi:carotenoid 1,2-hydratase
VIALVGSPFSPAYARARVRGPACAVDFSAMNVAVYGPRGSAWALHERVGDAVERRANGVTIGASTMRWDRDALVVDVEERSVAFGGRPADRVRGTVTVRPRVFVPRGVALTADGAHRWWPVAPLADVEVDLPSLGVRFSGHGYHDANAGDGPLEASFASWHWLRARAGREALLAYDVVEASGAKAALALRVRASGRVDAIDAVPAGLPRTVWGLERRAQVDAGANARVVRGLEDGPFYARALVATRLDGRHVLAMHETLDARRLRRAWVRFLAGFRMRRTA